MNKILLVPTSDYLGHPFPQRHNQIFERLHDGKEFEVHVARFKLFEKARLKSNLFIHDLDGVRVNKVAPYYLANTIDHAYQLKQIIKQNDINIVVLSNIASPFAFTLINQLTRSNVTTIVDLPDYFPTSAAGYLFGSESIRGKLLIATFNSMLTYMLRQATAVTVASHALGEYARIAGANLVEYVPNGIGEKFLQFQDGNRLRQKLGYREDDFVVGYIGSLEFWLDMKSLIKGVAIAKQKGLPVKLLIIGNKLVSSYYKKVNSWIEEEKIQQETTFLDFIPYDLVPLYISTFNVGIIPFDTLNLTAYYSAPNKMWEYLSQRKPVLCTPIPEALNNSDCVFIAKTPEQYASMFFSLAEKKSEPQKVEKGFSKALSKTWLNSTSQLASVIRSLIDKK
jgi:glycosyltransferase involved in cell wall biosynthesis